MDRFTTTVDVSVENHLPEDLDLSGLVSRIESYVRVVPVGPHAVTFELLALGVDGFQGELTGLFA